MNNVFGKKALIIGMARSGVALAEALIKNGAIVTVYDKKDDETMDPVRDELKGRVSFALGGDMMKLVEAADMVFISPGVPIDIAPLVHARELGKPVTGEVEYASTLCKAPIAAITGTNGKTTTTALLGEIMENTGRRTFVVGNIGTPFIASAMDTTAFDVVVAEISSFQMETAETFHPRAAAVLNITEDHLNRHHNMDTYIDCKARIFDKMEGTDSVVLNLDEPLSAALKSRVKSRLRWFTKGDAIDDGACVQNGMITLAENGEYRSVIETSKLRIPGAHNLENALAATVLADSMGASIDDIRRGLENFAGVEHRIEACGEVNGVRFINDSKGTNCDATLRAMAAMTSPTVLLLGGYDKGSDYRILFQQRPDEIKYVIALGATGERVMKNAEEFGFTNIELAGSFEDAVNRAYAKASSGWNVLLSPASASFDMFSDYEERGRVFKKLAKELGAK